MGNCCGGQANEGEISIKKGGFQTQQGYNQLFDEREVAGLRGTDKVQLIVRLQALFRGFLTRRKIKQQFGFQAKTMGNIDG
mmetsp:Transcript_22718/g.21900  ORF Transcript_22718/g.21900 Transcript_22718/m.21900 type:complete len:81 (+) Transcript_22718:29-271(+)